MNVLIWYKHDLRVEDHPALALAEGAAAVLPLYIVEPALWAQPDRSARQWQFVAETLQGLREDLAAMGAPLVVRVGDAVEVLARFCRQYAIDRIVSHSEPGCRWATARNQKVAAWASQTGVDWLELPQQGAVVAEPGALGAFAGIGPGVIPQARALRLADDPCPHRQIGGRAQGLQLLNSFLARRGLNYREAAGHPHLAERGSSRLSPFLTHGAISARELAQAVEDRIAGKPDGEWPQNLKHFQAQLRRRNAMTTGPGFLAGREDQTTQYSCHSTADQRFAAWASGHSGLPFCDAAMRYLAATGWLPMRLRAMVYAVAIGPIGLDPLAAARLLAQRLTDYDPGLFWPQIAALATGPEGPRQADPVKLGRSLDAEGLFTRRWLPELAAVPDAHLHSPWLWPGAHGFLGRRYPEAIVDIARAQGQSRRPPPGPDFPVIDLPFARPQPRRYRPAPAGQLSLDL